MATIAPQTEAMERSGSPPLTPPSPTKKNLTRNNTLVGSKVHESRVDDVKTSIAGCQVFVPLTSAISLDTSHLPTKLIVVINSNLWSVLQFLAFSGLVPGCLAVMFNKVGSVDELHFARSSTSTDVVMVRKRRTFCGVKVDAPVTVVQVGAPDDAAGAEEGEVDAEGGGGGDATVKTDAPPVMDHDIVVDGEAPGRGRELQLLINGEKMVVGALQHASVEEEGDVSAVIKAFCCQPLLRQEFLWLQNHMPDLLPVVDQMNALEAKNYRIQMLSLDLLHAQQLQEKQAMGVVLNNYELEQIALMESKREELSSLQYNMTVEEVREVKSGKE